MEQLAGVLGPDQLVTDVGSTKRRSPPRPRASTTRPIAPRFFPAIPWRARSAAARLWPTPISFAARSGSSPTIPPGNVPRAAQSLPKTGATSVAAMGSKTLDLDPARHDELVAWVSHLPQFTATALSALLEEEVGDAPELKDVGGRALREMTRLGASPYLHVARHRPHQHRAVERAARPRAAPRAPARKSAHARLRDEFEQANKFRRE